MLNRLNYVKSSFDVIYFISDQSNILLVENLIEPNWNMMWCLGVYVYIYRYTTLILSYVIELDAKG